MAFPVLQTCRASSSTLRRVPALISTFSSSATFNLEARKGQALPGESAEDAWRRNIKEVREWRRAKSNQRQKLNLFIPPSSTPPPAASPTKLSLSTLLASGAALGHATSSLAPAYMPYVYGNRSGLSVIDLDQTLPLLRRAANLVREVVAADGVIMIVGTREGHAKFLRKAHERMGDNAYTVAEWLPGTLTNSATFFGIEPITSKTYLPDLAIFLNPSENLGAIRECTAKNVPTVGVVDSNTDPRIVTYPIPANMESLRTSELILGALSIAGQEGRVGRERVRAERVQRM